jgi:hypothetical protein
MHRGKIEGGERHARRRRREHETIHIWEGDSRESDGNACGKGRVWDGLRVRESDSQHARGMWEGV